MRKFKNDFRSTVYAFRIGSHLLPRRRILMGGARQQAAPDPYRAN
jgi:hypothetical protein